MIPFFQWTTIPLGPLQVQVWGLFVAAGIAIGLLLSRWAAQKRGLNTKLVVDAASWIIIASLLGGRVVYVLSEWSRYSENIRDVFAVWQGGMSISGGFIGAVIAAVMFFRRTDVDFLEYADVTIFGLPIGLFIGRLGCFFIFDHPGAPTSFFLGQEYIDGIVRHNHGLYLSLNGLALTLVFALLWKRKPKTGMFLVVFSLWYGIVRFVLDFARSNELAYADSRWLGLTVAQYLSLAMIAAGAYLWYSQFRKSA